jgi:hypothetical protein
MTILTMLFILVFHKQINESMRDILHWAIINYKTALLFGVIALVFYVAHS